MGRLDGKVALVTRGTRGIGKCTQFTIDGGAHIATRYPTDLVNESYSERTIEG